MLSLRIVRNLSLGVLFLLLLSISGFYFLFQRKIISSLRYIVYTEDKKIAAWIKISQLANDANSDFHKAVIARSENIASTVSKLDSLNNELGVLAALPNTSYEVGIEEIRQSARKFKNALFGYSREMRDGYYGTNAVAMEKIALETADKISNLANTATGEIISFIKRKNRDIVGDIEGLNRIVIPLFFIGMAFILLTAFVMGYTLTQAIRIFIGAMEKISKGDFSYRISGFVGGDIGRLAGSFNKMAEDIKTAEETTQKAYQLLNEVTNGIEEQIMVLDNSYKIKWVNKKTMEFLGQDKEGGVLGAYCYKVLHGLERPPLDEERICPIVRARQTRKPYSLVHSHINKDGRRLYSEVSVYPLFSGNNIREFIHVSRDITAKMELEEKLKQNVFDLEAVKADLQRKMRELEKFHKVAIDRELRIVELKKRVSGLETIITKKA